MKHLPDGHVSSMPPSGPGQRKAEAEPLLRSGQRRPAAAAAATPPSDPGQRKTEAELLLRSGQRRPAAAAAAAAPTLTEVHNELFKQLRRLNDDALTGDGLKAEVERSRAVTSLSQTMINNAALVLKAHLSVANSIGSVSMPALITDQSPAGEAD